MISFCSALIMAALLHKIWVPIKRVTYVSQKVLTLTHVPMDSALLALLIFEPKIKLHFKKWLSSMSNKYLIHLCGLWFSPHLGRLDFFICTFQHVVDFENKFRRSFRTLSINITPVESVPDFKYLGIQITKDSSWSAHTEMVVKEPCLISIYVWGRL